MKILYSLIFSLEFIIISPDYSIGQWTNYNSGNTTEISSDDFRAATVGPDGVIYFATANGLLSFNGTAWTAYTEAGDNLAGNSVLSLLIDADQAIPKLWIGTETGLTNALVESGNFSVGMSYNTDNSGLYDNSIYSIGMTNDNVMIFGTGSNVNTLLNTDWAGIKDIGLTDSLALDRGKVVEISSNLVNTFLGSEGEGIFVCDNEVDGISIATFWVAPYNIPPYICQDLGGGKFQPNITAVTLDKNGNQWIATDLGVVLHEGMGAQSGWDLVFNTDNGLIDNNVKSVFIDSKDNVWLGTMGGVVKITDKQIKASYTNSDGLASNHVYDIIEGSDNSMWFLTDAGVSKFIVPNSTGGIMADPNRRLSVYPNPVRDNAGISFRMTEPGPARISLYDMNGRLLCILKDQYFDSGLNEFSTDLGAVLHGSGIYFIQFEADKVYARQKFVHIR